MNDAQIRERLRDAVGDARYPVGLASRVESRLMDPAADRSRAFQRREPRRPALRRSASLVAALLVVALMAALVVGVHAWRTGGLFTPHPAAPAGPTVKQYQTMLYTDEQRMLTAQSQNCIKLTDDCPAAAARVVAQLQAMLDDLNRTRTPARFVYVDAQMRRHIALGIFYLNAAVTAYNAQDQRGMDVELAAAVNERDALGTEAGDILASKQATVAVFITVVRSDQSNLVSCTACQRLAGQDPVTAACAADQAGCDDIATTRTILESMQGDLVRDFAPDALTAKSDRLQADLHAAYMALGAMESARTANDQLALQTARDAFRRAFSLVEADATAILNS